MTMATIHSTTMPTTATITGTITAIAPATAAVAHHHHPHRSLAEINRLIERSALSGAAQNRAKDLFHRLGEAEAAIHQIPIEKIHLHEVGALDSIIDIVGAVFALEWFGADRIVSSPLNVGGGMVNSAHGHFPVPAPATVKLLGGAPVYSSGVQSELVTPTGALLVTSYATSFGPVPAMTIDRVGYGAGDRDLPSTPNVLRVLVGESTDQPGTERIVVLECEIDDMNPQLFGPVMDRLYAAGALEVYLAAVHMKKNRPGTMMTILARPEQRQELSAIVFRETTTIGVRYHEVMRERLEREIVPVATPVWRRPLQARAARRERRQCRSGVRGLPASRIGEESAGEGRAGRGVEGVSGYEAHDRERRAIRD